MADHDDRPGPAEAGGPAPPALRALPSAQALLEAASAAGWLGAWSREAVVDAARAELSRARQAILAGEATDGNPAALLRRVRAGLQTDHPPGLRRVLNATGIIVHTNLGRAPMALEAVQAAAEMAGGACDLELDLETGRRGPRAPGLEALLRQVTGAQAGLCVNNNAAGLLLALTALAADGEVIVSRGELVEIGGGFRIPDIIQQGGARLVEVGSTNRTRLADYSEAITPRTRMLLKVHQSNFAMVGFTSAAGLSELAGLARARGLLLMDDLGSGALAPLPGELAPREPTVAQSIAAGSDIVAFSGDKLLGGPQAGFLAGQAGVIDRLRRHPLLRALRADKMCLAAAEATLRLHAGPHAAARLPVLRMLAQSAEELRDRAERLCAALEGLACTAHVEHAIGHAGGGALPGLDLPSRAVAVAAPQLSADTLARRLRAGRPAVVGRIVRDRLLLDVLTLSDDDVPVLAAAMRSALG